MADAKRARRLDKTLIPPAVTTEYINAIGMMFSLASLLMKVKYHQSVYSRGAILNMDLATYGLVEVYQSRINSGRNPYCY